MRKTRKGRMPEKQIELTREELFHVLTERKKEKIRQYKWLFERHLEDDDSYLINQQLFLNAKMFSDEILEIDRLLEGNGFTDKECEECGHINTFSLDDCPF